MAANPNSSWQHYNFPFSGQMNTSQSSIDYGSTSVLNIDLDSQGQRLVVHSKQSHDSRYQRQRLVSRQPYSLPFLEPNPKPCLFQHSLADFHLSSSLRRKELNFEAYSVLVDTFSADHPDIMYGTAADLLKEEMNRPPFSTCLNNKNKLDFYFPWKRREDCCKLCSKIRYASLNKESNPGQMLRQLGTTLPDISPRLLENLLQESNALDTCRLHFDTFLGNSLSCYALDTEQQALLLFPSGPGLDVLNFTHVPCSTERNTHFRPLLSKQQFAIHGQIRQIDFSSYSQKNVVTGIRSQYNCAFFQSCPSISNKDNSPPLKLLETVALTKQAMCIAVSPYIPGESVIVNEMGQAYIWTCDHALRMVCNQYQGSQDSPWFQCVFADNPRCIAMADVKGMDLLDFRADSLFKRFFFSIPSDQVDSFERVSAIQRHPKNLHHYVLATDQSLMILDDRFLQHPVLTWRHHNDDPIQFISVTYDAIPHCDDSVVMISGSRHGQTHCFQYSDCSQVTRLPVTASKYLPPQSVSSPWKVSPCNEWHYTGLCSDQLTYSPIIASRLSQPLIGVCTMPHTSHPQKGFTVFQMTEAGDLFYQQFISQECSDSEKYPWITDSSEQRRKELGKEAQILCHKWVEMIENQESISVEPVTFQVDYVEINKKRFCQDLLLLPKAHSNCALCNGGQTKSSFEKEQETGELTICRRCNLDTNYSSKLVEGQKNRTVLTKSSLSIHHEVKDLPISLDFSKATDPLSKSLWLNWNSDEPIPVFSDEEPISAHVGQQILKNTYSNKSASLDTSKQDSIKHQVPAAFSSSEQQAANQIDNIGIKTKRDDLPSQDTATSEVIPPARPRQMHWAPSDGEVNYSPSMQGVASLSRLKPLGNSPKKSKIVKRKSGHIMGF